jgi:hypothetical protein
MSDDYDVGYGTPPREHQFKKGNRAARQRKAKTKALSLPEIIDRALRTKRKVKRGGEVYSIPVAEILGERLIHTMTTGSARDLAMIVQLLEKYLPNALAAEAEKLEIIHHRADGSKVALPPADLWEGDPT